VIKLMKLLQPAAAASPRRALILLMALLLAGGCATSPAAPATATVTNSVPVTGRTLFLHNCAHCHAADATGDDGPDLHNLDFTDQWIANRIRTGKAGQMTAFAGKLQPDQISALVAYVQSLK
jgi:mono/diheme cytochrome c family protein